MMSFVAYITGFFMNFELLPILTDYANKKKGGMKFKYFELGGHLGWKSGSPDTILEGGHPRIISAEFG
jgi:hypothetical protein